jgi:hypothetical protein
MIHFDDLYFSNIGGGRLDGFCAVTLEVGAEKSEWPEVLLSSILGFGRTKLFRIYGDYKFAPVEDLYTLLACLKDNGYVTVGILDGQNRQPWMDLLSLKIVNITEQPWLGFAASEIHYQPMRHDNIETPQLQEIHTQSSLYIDASRDLTPTEIFSFLKKNPGFRIYSPPSKVYRMTVPIKEVEWWSGFIWMLMVSPSLQSVSSPDRI